jgi:SAM-dependent methyltransferase
MTVRNKFKAAALSMVRRFGGPVQAFHSYHYLRHNARRLEHLASLGIRVSGMSVLEVGAGIGDHSHFYIDRGCDVTITDARTENLDLLRQRYPRCDVQFLDMDSPQRIEGSPFDLVHCYGLLYHLSKPLAALKFLSENASRLMFLETCVSFGEGEDINLIGERQSAATQAFSGTGCRPTRTWLFRRLSELFEYVYVPRTQPCHVEFPLDWTVSANHRVELQRAVFIASRQRLDNDILSTSLVMQQNRHP